jgi:hypothetical protein
MGALASSLAAKRSPISFALEPAIRGPVAHLREQALVGRQMNDLDPHGGDPFRDGLRSRPREPGSKILRTLAN